MLKIDPRDTGEWKHENRFYDNEENGIEQSENGGEWQYEEGFGENSIMFERETTENGLTEIDENVRVNFVRPFSYND